MRENVVRDGPGAEVGKCRGGGPERRLPVGNNYGNLNASEASKYRHETEQTTSLTTAPCHFGIAASRRSNCSSPSTNPFPAAEMARLSANPARLRARSLSPIVVSAALLLLLLLAGAGEGPRVVAAQDVLVASQHVPLMMEVRRQWARFVDLSSWDARKPCSKWAFVTCNKLTGEVRTCHKQATSGSLFTCLPASLIIPPAASPHHLPFSLPALPSLFSSLPSHAPPVLPCTCSYMDNNRMTGVIPASIGNFTKAVNFFINGNFIDGPIPSTVGSMTSLDTLFLSGNWIKGPLPSTIGNLKNLKHFIMEFNNISGPIPSTIGDMVKCERILLDNNYLTGVIPPTISKLTNLVWLFLQGNFLEGEVPVGITKLPNLFYFNLASNRLSGTANWDFTNAAIKGGEVNLRSNYFYGTPSFTAAGKPFCPITKTSKMNGLDQIFLSSSKFNCFTFPAKYPCPGFNEPGYSSPAVCQGFCGASSPQGTCNGLGYCSKTSTVVGGWGCVCDAGATLAPNGTWCLPGKSSTYGQKSMTFLRG
ncbi:unnamed protein product [Closterium sp. NIES-54]